MTDVFISYARPDERRAQQVAETLRGLGHLVWRDDDLPAHRAYSEVIEERLKSAKAVIVLWSGEAAKSQWVRAEADAVTIGEAIAARLALGPFESLPAESAARRIWAWSCSDSQREYPTT